MLIKHFDDYSFTVKAYPESHYVKFEIFEIKGTNAEDRLYGEDAGLAAIQEPHMEPAAHRERDNPSIWGYLRRTWKPLARGLDRKTCWRGHAVRFIPRRR